MNKKQKKILKISIIVLVLLFIVYSLLFIVIRPFNGYVVEDSPLLSWLCDRQWACGNGDKITMPCERGKYDYTWEKLRYWSKFQGCNNNTPGFNEVTHNIEGIKICGCGGLQ